MTAKVEQLDSGNNIPDGQNTSGERARLGVGVEPDPGGKITSAPSPQELDQANRS